MFLIGCVRTGLVLLEAADESGMDTDGAHDVLVLSVQTTEAFAIVSQEPRIRTRFSSVIRFVVKASARDGHRKREAFRNSDNNQCH